MRTQQRAIGHALRLGCSLTLTMALGLPTTVRARSITSVTAFYLRGKGTTEADTARLSRKISKALRDNPNIRVHDSDKLLAQSAGDVPRARIRRATAACEAGIRQLQAGEPKEAVKALRSSVAEFVELLPFIKKRLLARAQLGLAVALASSGKSREAKSTLVRLLTWRPMLAYDSNTFDATYLPLFMQARSVVKQLRRGSIELATDPRGAKAYVDGRYVGVTPTAAWGLTVGQHYATFKKAGYIKGGMPVEVDPKKQTSYTRKLRRSEKFLLIEQAMTATRAALGQKKASSAMIDLGRVLFVDQIVFVEVRRLGPVAIETHAYLYDLRSKLLLNEVRQTINPKRMAEVSRLARLLYLNARYDGSLPPPPTPPPPKAPAVRPLYARWWFWTAIGAGLAAGAVAIAVPLALQEPGCPDGNRCVLIQN